jgi:hypothetical protein
MEIELMKVFTASFVLALSACGPTEYHDIGQDSQSKTPRETAIENQMDEAVVRQQKTDAIRQADPALNWVGIGISTGKFSESMASWTFRTYDECVKYPRGEASECIPIPALPKSYWDAENIHGD